MFPYDKMKCSLELGGFMIGGGQQGIGLIGEGYEFSSQEATAGASYTEYSIDRVNASLSTYFYECCPNDPVRALDSNLSVRARCLLLRSGVLVPHALSIAFVR